MLLAFLLAAAVQGVVIEQSSGRPVARAEVTLARLAGDGAEERVTKIRSDPSGQFRFSPLDGGTYLLHVNRRGFAEGRYRQRRPGGPPAPFDLAAGANLFAELRLVRLGAVSGTVYDANGVGLPGFPVVVYEAGPPLRQAASATTDERGWWRAGSLAPGRYLARTGPGTLEDGSEWLPTFSFLSRGPEDARRAEVQLEQEVIGMDIQPTPGRQFAISGEVQGPFAPGSVTVSVTLSSGLGRQAVQAACCPARFRFARLTPENYELFAEVAGEPEAAWLFGFYNDEKRDIVLELGQPPETSFRISPPEAPPVTLLARRKDLAGPGETREIQATGARLAPGYWEIQARPASGWYLTRFGSGRRFPSWAGWDPDWFETMVMGRGPTTAVLDLAQGTGGVYGTVTLADSKPVPWAPVYLHPESTDVRRRMAGIRTGRAGANGRYTFDDLVPGDYLLLSSYDLTEATPEVMTRAGAVRVSLASGQRTEQALRLHQRPED
ncbi:MAG: carboxypeptidase regulatory-like domain-containing protein [Bryobacterales bacterium]|nr:carboxypeptidase regulatory-like domain-containing protein [Bryobacterales bacterium]